ncbi:hypothetical protein HHK36_022820 [Tetracentron sinense]|uniref:CUE domain-containing protein n=1 Tax=Tetracentron sinense TaxID=13715 RepID=A0A835D6F8_TETSI|nr:hypothetical protein HHK36_022820 [Tetracentron sinense]
MGSSSGYQSLQELFPYVDAGILKAFASEHSVDAAAEIILHEVLPYMFFDPVPQEAPHSSKANGDVKDPSVGGGESENQRFLNYLQEVEEATAGPSKLISVASEDANETDHTNHPLYGADLLEKCQEISVTVGSDQVSNIASSSLIHAGVESHGQTAHWKMENSPDTIQLVPSPVHEEMVDTAENNKKTLSAIESPINLMREVELQEKAVDQAKEEPSRGGLGILAARAEDFKKMLRYAKETNDNHAGEVYRERSILTFGVRELQSRLLSLSDDKDKSLTIIDEIRRTLEARLVAAEEEWKAAEQENIEKEKSAGKALAKQEVIMEKMYQESKKLQQEAAENSKLREFLMDRKCIVDILQEEMAVICRDVKLLKEKFVEPVPLSKSVSSSQMDGILASSSSSITNMAFDLVPEHFKPSESLKKSSPTQSVDDRSQNSSSEEEGVRDDHKVLLDDGWDFLDDYVVL